MALLHMQVFDQMQAEGVAASEVTFGCLLVACERLGDVDRAFQLYKQACGQGIAPSDECHNILVNVCAATGRSAAPHTQFRRLMRMRRIYLLCGC